MTPSQKGQKPDVDQDVAVCVFKTADLVLANQKNSVFWGRQRFPKEALLWQRAGKESSDQSSQVILVSHQLLYHRSDTVRLARHIHASTLLLTILRSSSTSKKLRRLKQQPEAEEEEEDDEEEKEEEQGEGREE